MPTKECRTCKFWAPKYSGVGVCRGEGRAGAKFWVADEKAGSLLTLATFACQSWEKQDDIAKDSL